jgi:PAS domain S-box-containing protein
MKPFDPHILRAKVAVFIDLWQKTVEIRRQDALLKEQEITALERSSEERYRFLGDSIPQQVWTALPDGALDYVNQRVLAYFDRSFKEVIGEGWSEFVHEDDLPETIERWTEALRTGDPYEVELRVRRASDGAYRWHLARAVAMRSDRGEIVRWFGTNTDIEERRVAEERQTFLAEAGWVLGSSLDYEQTLTDVAGLAVPRIADWCAIDIFVDGRLERLALTHVDPAKVKLARQLQEAMLHASEAAGATAIRARQPVLVREIDDEALATFGFRRGPARDRARDRASLVRHGPPRRTRRGLRLDQPRHGRVRAHVRGGRPDARPGAGQARRGSDRQRPAVRRGRAKRTRGTGARSRRRRGRPRRSRRRDPALEHGCADDHRRGGGGRAREEDRGRRPRVARDRTADSRGEQAGRAGPGRDGAGRVRWPRALDLGLGGRLRRGNGLCLP